MKASRRYAVYTVAMSTRDPPPSRPMTLGNRRANGVRSLSVTCDLCHHEAVLSIDQWGDEVPVPASGLAWCARGAGSSAPMPGRTGTSTTRRDVSRGRTRNNAVPRVRDRRQNLKSNPDGSIDIYVQKDSPGAGKESNWLPAPPGKFILMLRMYWPNENDPPIIDGTWTIPAVKKAS